MDPLTSKLSQLQTELKDYFERQSRLQQQVDIIDSKIADKAGYGVGGFESKSLADEIYGTEQFKAFAETGRGRVAIRIPDLQKKTAITNTALGSYTSGVIMGQRLPGIVPAALRTFRVRELLRVIPSTAAAIDFVRVLTYSQASPAPEASTKFEGAMTFESVSERMKTLAVWIPASKQALADLSALQETINVHLMAGLYDEEDEQLLIGDNTGENLNGLITQATAFDTSLLVASDGHEYSDMVARAIQQLEVAKQRCTGIVLNPAQWWSIILSKDSTGRYIHGDPTAMAETRLWGRPVAVTTAVPSGTFLVGDFQTGAALHVRMDGVIELSDSHDQFFVLNKVAIRCEARETLAVYKPSSFVTGQFSQSPL